ncbi:hypothetical protein E4U52_004035 [Claviceps spartinae]|nr:hypothetical protein E4U52_004035 [Claviceps spartinae]
MSSGSLWDLVVLSWLDQMDEIGEGTSLPTSDDIEISFIGIPVNVAALVSNMVADDINSQSNGKSVSRHELCLHFHETQLQ